MPFNFKPVVKVIDFPYKLSHYGWHSIHNEAVFVYSRHSIVFVVTLLSANDMNWFNLMFVLAKCDEKSLRDNEVKELSTSEHRRLLSSYPMIVAQHFSHRFQAFMNQILNGASKPIGEIKDYFWRVEYQQRGSPHIHSLWWVEDAPDIKTVEGRRKAPGFIDKYISCHVQKGGEDDDLKDLVLRLQKHNHTQT